MRDNPFLDTLLVDFTKWADTNPDCRTILLFGSAARSIRPADEYSDRDISLFTINSDNRPYIDWMGQYAPTWMVIQENNAPTDLWIILYEGGHSVHLSINSVDDLQQIVDSQKLWTDQQRGYKVLLDKDGLCVKLPPPSVPPYTPPPQTEFVECVESCFYGFVLIAKQLRRNNLWAVRQAFCIEQGFLLKMIEWHTHAIRDVDTWYRGEAMQEWVDDKIWQSLHDVFGYFDAKDSWRALFAFIELFQKLVQETADKLGYTYPKSTATEIIKYIETLSG